MDEVRQANGAERMADGDNAVRRRDGSLARRIARQLGFADLMAVLMVAATAMSAFATWRMAALTRTLLAVSARPYIGVAGVSFDTTRADIPRVRVEFRNFGHIYATDGVVRVRMLVDGKRLPRQSGAATTLNVGMVSPTVPHLFYRSVPNGIYSAVVDGRAKMVVRNMVHYRGPDQREFCYNEFFTYDPEAGGFVSIGGDDHCGEDVY